MKVARIDSTKKIREVSRSRRYANLDLVNYTDECKTEKIKQNENLGTFLMLRQMSGSGSLTLALVTAWNMSIGQVSSVINSSY